MDWADDAYEQADFNSDEDQEQKWEDPVAWKNVAPPEQVARRRGWNQDSRYSLADKF